MIGPISTASSSREPAPPTLLEDLKAVFYREGSIFEYELIVEDIEKAIKRSNPEEVKAAFQELLSGYPGGKDAALRRCQIIRLNFMAGDRLRFPNFSAAFDNPEIYRLYFPVNKEPITDVIPKNVSLSNFMRDWFSEDVTKVEGRLRPEDVSGENVVPLTMQKIATHCSKGSEEKKEAFVKGVTADFEGAVDYFQRRGHLSSYSARNWKEQTSLSEAESIPISSDLRVGDFAGAAVTLPSPERGGSKPLGTEDRYLATSILVGANEVPLFAVLDGHSLDRKTKDASACIQRILPERLKGKLEALTDFSDLSMEKALTALCMELGEELQDMIDPDANTGTTMVFSFILEGNIWTVNVGDSRAALFDAETGKCMQLTEDADPSNSKFADFVTRRGGSIDLTGYVTQPGSIGKLAMATSLEAGFSRPSCIIPYPTITKKPVTDGSILAIASDGVWDVLSCRQVLEFINKKVGEGSALEEAAQHLASYGNTLSHDDATILIMYLKTGEEEPASKRQRRK